MFSTTQLPLEMKGQLSRKENLSNAYIPENLPSLISGRSMNYVRIHERKLIVVGKFGFEIEGDILLQSHSIIQSSWQIRNFCCFFFLIVRLGTTNLSLPSH